MNVSHENIYLIAGDEILAVNGTPLQGLSHAEAIQVFKSIRNGQVVIHAARRDVANKRFIIILSFFMNSKYFR